MARNWLLAHWRRIAMQTALCAVLLVTVGVAALVTHQKRLALRLPLTGPQAFGRLLVALPKGWSPPQPLDHPETADVITVDEVVPEPATGRRLTVMRVRCGGLMAPLDLLTRTGILSERDLTGQGQGVHDPAGSDPADPARVLPMKVAGWPGVMVLRTSPHLAGRRPQKQVLGCAVLPYGQGVVIRLDGVGTVDAADEVLVRQIAEATAVTEDRGRGKSQPILPQMSGAVVELGDGVLAAVPDHFTVLQGDTAMETARQLISDGSTGHWTTVELIPCLWLENESPEEQILTMLAARDSTWHSASVTKLGDNLYRADRVTLANEMRFPARAYCFTNGADQALLTILRGGWHDDSTFDATWAGVSSNVRFTQHRDLPALIDRGTAEVKQLRETGLLKMLPPHTVGRRWTLWDPAENSDKRDWMNYIIGPSTADGMTWSGSRLTIPTQWSPIGAGAGEGIQQSWGGSSDFSSYWLHTDRTASTRGETFIRTTTQRLELRDQMLRNPLASDEPRPTPPQYLPGGWLPVALGHVDDQPLLMRTESFLGCDGAAPPGFLTLYVKRLSGDCVSVTVNGSGRVTRWWYDASGLLASIDLGSELRAQSLETKVEP